MTAELVVVIAIMVWSLRFAGSFAGLRPVRSHTTTTNRTRRMSTPMSVEPRYLRPLVPTANPTVPARFASRQKTPTGAMTMTKRIIVSTICWI